MVKKWMRKYAERKFLHDVQRGRCAACSGWMDLSIPAPSPMAPTFDHVIPASHSGPNHLRNYVLKHYRCNVQRGNAPPSGLDLHWHAEVNRRVDEEQAQARLVWQAWVRDHPIHYRIRTWALAHVNNGCGGLGARVCAAALGWARWLSRSDPPSHWTLRRLL